MDGEVSSWKSDRKQRVVVDGEVSSWKSGLSGVPQGSVHLCSFYVNNMLPIVTLCVF